LAVPVAPGGQEASVALAVWVASAVLDVRAASAALAVWVASAVLDVRAAPVVQVVQGQRPGQGGGGINNSGNRVNTGDRNTNINVDNDWGGDWNGWGDYPIGAGIAIGAVAGMTAMAYGSAFYALPGGCSPYPYHSYTYYNCGGAYYQPQYEGDTVVYVTVPDPTTVTVQP
jgi:hypothetical protein